MNKAELVEALAQHYEGSKAEAARALNAVVQTITRTTAAGEKVAITGFGVFEKVQRPARTVRNPRTGERKEAPATAVPRFRAGTELKAYVAGSRELPELSVEAPARVPRPARTSTRPSATAAEPVADQPLAPTQAGAGSAPAEAARPSSTKRRAAAGGKKADAKAAVKPRAKKAVAAEAEPKKADSKKAGAKKAAGKKADTSKGDAKNSGKKADAKKGGKKSGKK